MKNWQKWAVGALTLGGSILGVGLMAYFGMEYWPNAVAVGLFSLLGFVFVFGTYVGLQILRGADNAYGLAIPYWAAQIPVFFSSHFSFQFICGGAVAVTANAEGILGFSPRFGSALDFNLGVAQTTTIGVNVLALAVVLILLKGRKRSRANTTQVSC